MLTSTTCLATLLPSAIAAPVQPDFRASEGIWTLDGRPFVGTTAHAIFHTFRRDRHAGLRDLEGLADAGFTTAEVYWVWARDQAEDGSFSFDALDEFVLACRGRGLRNFCAIIHPAPDWLAARYGWHHLDEDGKGPTADGFYICDPTFVEESDRFVQALLDHLDERPEVSGNILHFALGGEYYPFQPDREFDTGYEEATVTAFREALRQRFSLGVLGERWNADEGTYAAWEEVWPPVRLARTDFRGRELAKWDAASWDWYEFRADAVTSFFRHTVQLIRDAGDTRPITHEYNVRAPGRRRHMRWETLAGDGTGFHLATMDFTGEYDYPDMLWWLALARGGSHPPQQNNEFTGYASWHWLTRHAWAMQALGATGLNVWDWRSADWGLALPDGTPRDGLPAAERLNAQVRALGDLLAGSRPLPEQVSILLLDEEDFRRPNAHETEIKQLLSGLLALGVGGQVNIVTNAALSDSRLADTRLLIVPHLRHVRRGVAEQLAEFVRDGGTLWLMPGSFTRDELNALHSAGPCPPLGEVAGVRARSLREPAFGDIALGPALGGGPPAPGMLVERLRLDGSEALATLDGQSALTLGAYGKGRCLYQAAEFADLTPMLEGWEGRTGAVIGSLAAQLQRVPEGVLESVLSLSGVAAPATVTEGGQRAPDVLVSARDVEGGRLVFLIDLYNRAHSLQVRVPGPGGRQAVQVLPTVGKAEPLRRGAFATELGAAEVQAWLVASRAEVARRRQAAELELRHTGAPAPPPAPEPYPITGEVATAPEGGAPPLRALGDGFWALDLTAHANRSLVEDAKPGALYQFVTQRFDVEVTEGRLDLTFRADEASPAGPFWVINELRVEGAEERRFDFGNGPVGEGYSGVTETEVYSPEAGFGWVEAAGLASRDRATSNADAIRRDFMLDRAANGEHTFRIDLPDGPYVVTVTMGDAHFHWGPMSILANGEAKLSGVQTGSPSIAKVEAPMRRRRFFGSGGNDLRELPVGDVTLGGVPFHILDPAAHDNSCLMFASRTREVSRLVRAEGIRVELGDVKAIHFLHGAGWNAPMGTPIGRYVARYADGTRAVRQIVAGINIGSWWGDGVEHGPSCEPAWVGSNPGARRWDTNCVLWRHCWENPHPEKRLEALDIEGYWLSCNPFVVAISVESGQQEG